MTASPHFFLLRPDRLHAPPGPTATHRYIVHHLSPTPAESHHLLDTILAIDMFAPTAANNGGPATATRSRRRRERPKSSESLVQQPKAKRQRLPLTEQTFTNPDANVDMVEAKQDKTPNLPTPRSSEGIENLHSTPTPRRESNIRSKKQKHGDRAVNKGDGSLVLVRASILTLSVRHADEIRPVPMHTSLASYQRCQTGFAQIRQVRRACDCHAIVF